MFVVVLQKSVNFAPEDGSASFDAHENEHEEQEYQPEWVPFVGGPFTKEDNFCVDIRRLQQKFKCSDATCDEVVKLFGKYFGNQETNFRQADGKIAKASGTKMLRLHGCVNVRCKGYVFLPSDKLKNCPKCGQARYDHNGKPFEVNCLFHAFCLLVCTTLEFARSLLIYCCAYNAFLDVYAESFLLPCQRPS